MRELANHDILSVSGAISFDFSARQATALITMGVGAFGDALVNSALSQFGVPPNKFVTRFVVSPATKILFTGLGFGLSNYVLAEEEKSSS